MKKLSSLLLILLLSLSLVGLSQAQVYISGPLSGILPDTTYIVVGHIEVLEGDSLYIQSGATFLITEGCWFHIGGYLHAAGTEEDSVKFMLDAGATSWQGIDFYYPDPDSSILEYCLITGSSNCGIYCYHATPTISYCTIRENTAGYEGGGIRCHYSDPIISHCVISDNEVPAEGGGIQCYNSSPSINSCTIRGNSSGWAGGGINYLGSSGGSIINSLITENFAADYGGGVNFFTMSGASIINCTISANSANIEGGGLYHGSPIVVNCIHWSNNPPQIQSYMQTTYSDIQNGWPGLGNIDEDPLFVMPEQNDFRLQWGSPCIDSGNPDPIYNDPDGTRADMGAFYFDQSLSVRLLLTPHDAPISIPPEGGSFDFTIQATNIDTISHLVNVWCDITLPSGQIVGPVLGPVSIEIGSDVTVARQRTQAVPAHAPGGLYHYNGYAVVESDTSTDSFVFYKQGMGGGQATGGWSNWGEDFTIALSPGRSEVTEYLPSDFALLSCHPNPCNPTTTLRFELRDASFVELSIYDISGRLVTTLVDGWREAGLHEVTFDGSKLPSGVYIARLKAAGCRQWVKLVLIK